MKDEAHIKQHFEDKDQCGDDDGRAEKEEKRGPGNPVADEDSMVKMIDGVLEQMDINGDGYIDFAEYMKVGN
ncbi:unnamed protein product, partial [Mesorhabditis belari]|uniref:EF-hand domain-containing protein n=1 Tax=Mesorhabditis belari TaxID=2138241 RepID=A0AAF3EKQ0_9BILA